MAAATSQKPFGLDQESIFPSSLVSLPLKTSTVTISASNNYTDDDDSVVKKKNRRRRKKFQVEDIAPQKPQDIIISKETEDGAPVVIQTTPGNQSAINSTLQAIKHKTQHTKEKKTHMIQRNVIRLPDCERLELMEYFTSAVSKTPQGNSYHRVKYATPTLQELKVKLKNDLIKESVTTKLHFDKYLLLLILYSWNKKQLWSEKNKSKDSQSFFQAKGVFRSINPPLESEAFSTTTDEDDMCAICCSSPTKSEPLEMFSPIACQHSYCVDCWISYIKEELKGPATLIKCMECDTKLSYTEIQYVSDREVVARKPLRPNTFSPGDILNELVGLKSSKPPVIDDSPRLIDIYWSKIVDLYRQIHTARVKSCPTPDCDGIICLMEYDSDEVNSPLQLREKWALPMVKCINNHRFCFCCNRAYHFPFPCQPVDKWKKVFKAEMIKIDCLGKEESVYLQKKAQLERQRELENRSIDYINLNAKKCPQCRSDIEKNGGCNHMICRCGHQFCWVCLGPHDGHIDLGCSRKATLIYKEPHVSLTTADLDKIKSSGKSIHLLKVDNIDQTVKSFHEKNLSLKELTLLREKISKEVGNYRINESAFLVECLNELDLSLQCSKWTEVLVWHLPENDRAPYTIFNQSLSNAIQQLMSLVSGNQTSQILISKDEIIRLKRVMTKMRDSIEEFYVDDVVSPTMRESLLKRANLYH
jgi:ariadne-1